MGRELAGEEKGYLLDNSVWVWELPEGIHVRQGAGGVLLELNFAAYINSMALEKELISVVYQRRRHPEFAATENKK